MLKGPAPNTVGVGGFVGTSMTIVTLPVATPFMPITSPDSTSEKLMLALILVVCMLIMFPCLNSAAVACPNPDAKVILIVAGRESGDGTATNDALTNLVVRLLAGVDFLLGLDFVLLLAFAIVFN